MMLEYIDQMPAGDFLAIVTLAAWILDRWTK